MDSLWKMLILLGLLLAGCGVEDEFDVSGHITLDGKPLPQATISFISDDPQLTGAVARTNEQGKYVAAIGIDQQGLALGTYKVRISTFDEGDQEAEPPLPSVKERVPSKYNLDSQLTAEVKAEANVFDFVLDSKGRKN